MEIRTCYLYHDLSHLEDREDWKDLKSLVKMDKEVFYRSTGKTTRETRYDISSLDRPLLEKTKSLEKSENKLFTGFAFGTPPDYSGKNPPSPGAGWPE